MKNLLFLSVLVVFSISPLEASEASFMDKVKVFFSQLVGGEKAENTEAKPKTQMSGLVLPPAPDLSRDARSLKVYKEYSNDKQLEDPLLRKRLNYTFIKELFYSVKGEEAEDQEVSSWLSALEQGASREGIYRSLVLDAFYEKLQALENLKSQGLDNFVIRYYQKFLYKEIPSEQLESLNLFTLKKLTTERSLEFLDGYMPDRNKLSTWYGIVSAHLGAKYGHLYKHKLRSSTDARLHKSWADNVPLQHVKSELIIKLHLGMNSLVDFKNQ